MSRMSRLSNETFNPSGLLPTMFSPGTAQAVATPICNNSLLQAEMDGLRRPVLENHEHFLLQSRIHKLSGQNSGFREEARPSFAATLNHPSFAAAEMKYDFASSDAHFSSQQQQNLPSTEEKLRSMKPLVNKDGNNSTTSSGMMKNCPVAIKSNLLRHRSSPASLFSGLATEALSINTRHAEQNGSSLSTQLHRFENNNNVVNFSEEAGLTSLSEAPELSARGLDEDSISNEGSLMSILDGPSSLRKRARALDAVQMNVSSPSDLQEGTADQSKYLIRHMSLPVPLISKDVSPGDDGLPDSVPCRLRAKRGCATHPRSIAERVRRTRISERMRNLQELVPNMDKQSNTVDMLDEAIEYVKFLQRQVQELSQSRATCEKLCKLNPNETQPS